MSYGKRVARAMEIGGFTSDAKLAEKLTDLLREQGRLAPNKIIPEATIQSARTRIKKDGLSKYTLDIAKVCAVNAYWLAFGIGNETGPDGPPTDPVTRSLLKLWRQLFPPRQNSVLTYAANQLSEQEANPMEHVQNVVRVLEPKKRRGI